MADPKLIVDAMLGRLARWLRILDLDVVYDADLEDADLVARALREDRWILTRDRRLIARRRARKHLLIESERVEEQMVQVVRELGLPIRRRRLFGRCLICNEPLDKLAPATARQRVPAFVARTQNRFRQCPSCHRIYWPATHVYRMVQKLAEVEAASAPREQKPHG